MAFASSIKELKNDFFSKLNSRKKIELIAKQISCFQYKKVLEGKIKKNMKIAFRNSDTAMKKEI